MYSAEKLHNKNHLSLWGEAGGRGVDPEFIVLEQHSLRQESHYSFLWSEITKSQRRPTQKEQSDW